MMKAIDKQWGIHPQREKALMLAWREVAAFVCDAVNLEGLPFTQPARCLDFYATGDQAPKNPFIRSTR